MKKTLLFVILVFGFTAFVLAQPSQGQGPAPSPGQGLGSNQEQSLGLSPGQAPELSMEQGHELSMAPRQGPRQVQRPVQDMRPRPRQTPPPAPARSQRNVPPSEEVTVSGNLTVANGMPAIKSDDTTYLVFGINRLSGFIDGLKEGAQVTVDGTAMSNPRDDTLKFLRPSNLNLNGKDYDLTPPRAFTDWQNKVPPRETMRQPRTPSGRPAPRYR